MAGTPGFMAPEVITADKYDGFAADVWSVGCIALELSLGHDKFLTVWMGKAFCDAVKNADAAIVSSEMKGMVVKMQEEVKTCVKQCNLSAAGQELILRMLSTIPKQRPDVRQALSHRWIGGRMTTSVNAASLDASKPTITKAEILRLGKSMAMSRTASAGDLSKLAGKPLNIPQNTVGISETKPAKQEIPRSKPSLMINTDILKSPRRNESCCPASVGTPPTPGLTSATRIMERGEQLLSLVNEGQRSARLSKPAENGT